MLPSFKIKSLCLRGALVFWANLFVLTYLLRKGKFHRSCSLDAVLLQPDPQDPQMG